MTGSMATGPARYQSTRRASVEKSASSRGVVSALALPKVGVVACCRAEDEGLGAHDGGQGQRG